MKLALINTEVGALRQVMPAGQGFDVAPPLMWIDCADDVTTTSHEWNGTELVPRTITLIPKRRKVLKSTIRARLRAAELETAADTLLGSLPETIQKDWGDYIIVFSDNEIIRGYLTALGADVEAILAPDPDVATVLGSA